MWALNSCAAAGGSDEAHDEARRRCKRDADDRFQSRAEQDLGQDRRQRDAEGDEDGPQPSREAVVIGASALVGASVSRRTS
jgi:hypothetical protein